MARSGQRLSENLNSKIGQLATDAFSEFNPSKGLFAGKTNINMTGKPFGLLFGERSLPKSWTP